MPAARLAGASSMCCTASPTTPDSARRSPPCCSPLDLPGALYGREVSGKSHDFDAVWREISSQLWRSIYAYAGGSREVADDAVVEAFARAMEQDGVIDDPKAYISRIAFRVAAADMKLRSRHVEHVDEVAVDGPRVGALVDALRHLSPSQRAAVYLHYEADLPVRQVASLMGTSPAAVKVHLMRGRRRLAVLLREIDDDD